MVSFQGSFVALQVPHSLHRKSAASKSLLVRLDDDDLLAALLVNGLSGEQQALEEKIDESATLEVCKAFQPLKLCTLPSAGMTYLAALPEDGGKGVGQVVSRSYDMATARSHQRTNDQSDKGLQPVTEAGCHLEFQHSDERSVLLNACKSVI